MTGDKDTTTREARLAAQLRGNLRRRKAQARAMAGSRDAADVVDSGEPGLSKSPREG